MTKSELQEHLIMLQAEHRKERLRNRLLVRENKRLCAALKSETARFERLSAYIKTLREWACSANR